MGILKSIKKYIFLAVCIMGMGVNAQKVLIVSQNGEKGTYKDMHLALAAASRLIVKDGYPDKGIQILIKDGYYKIEKSIVVSGELKGSVAYPLIIKAENPGEVHFFGGTLLDFDSFKKFKEKEAGFELVDKNAISKIKVVDLKKVGIKKNSLGKFVKHGFGFDKNPNFTTPAMLWVDGERMQLSRWPNVDESSPYFDNVNQFKGKFSDVDIVGAVSMVDVIDAGLKKTNMWFKNKEFLENGNGKFSVAFDRANQWNYAEKSSEKIWLDGVVASSWEWEYTQVKSIKDKVVTLASGTNRGVGFFRKVSHFHFENVPEELNSPGEYFIDREKMLLYFYPLEDMKGKTITLSTLSSDMLKLVGVANVKIEGIVFESGRENAIVVNSAIKNKKIVSQTSNIVIENCTIRNFNQWGVLVQGVKSSLVNNCHIYNMGAGGVKLGSDTKSFSLVKENNIVSNCEIHHIAFDQKSQVPGVTLAGCGNIARNNEIYNTPHFAIKIKYANDCLAENNFLHDLPEYHHFDGGALYLATGGQFYNRGNMIQHNYFKDISTNGAYLDNYTMGNRVVGNVFDNVGNSTKGSKNGAVYIHGGGQNTVENNIAIDCPYAYKTGSHIVKASNTTNYLYNWYTDANEFFKPTDVLYAKYCERYPEMKYFLKKIHNSPELIKNHVRNNTLKQISNAKNKKTQIDAYDLQGATAFDKMNGKENEWANWFQLRYQSTLFKNNVSCFTSDSYLPDLTKTKGAYVLGGSSGVFEMAPYKLNTKTGSKKITNHVFEGNQVFKTIPESIGVLSKQGTLLFEDIFKMPGMIDFIEIDFKAIGIKK